MPSYLALLLLATVAQAIPHQQPFNAGTGRVEHDPSRIDYTQNAKPPPDRLPPTLDDAPELDDTPSTPERRKEMAELLDKYAPVFKLASTERYFPSSVKFMLDRYGYISWKNGTTYRPGHEVINEEHVADLPRRGRKQILSIDEPANAQPDFPDNEESWFLYGPSGQPGALEPSPDGRGRVHDDVYGFWVDQGRGVVDLWYWTYYPYNLGKLVGYLGWLGNHVSDWEHMRIRTINGTAQSADYDTHSGGPFSAGTYRWIDIERWGDRPVAYVASGSHGVWPDAGKHVYAQLLNLWQLVDVTDDYGPIWDTKGHVVPIEYWTGPNRAKKLWHTGKDAWLNFVGFWGNLGSDTCWWHSFVGICQLMTGPPGPNRKFGGPPDCLLGVAQDDWSKYSFYLSANATLQAPWHNITTVVVEQVCARPGMAFKSSYDDPWTDPALKPEDLEIWTIPHPIPYAGRAEHSVTLPACGGQRSAAKAYRLAMYDGLGEWVTTSPIRNVCTYVPDQAGWIMSSGADVMDWDEWRWEFRPVVPNVTLADGTRGQPKRTPPPVQWPLPRPIRF